MTRDESARNRIRSSLDESLIVEAAAGTGKTTELVRRIVNILKTGRTTVDRVVAVTFTRKAAGELRLRLRIELDTARTASDNPAEILHLEDALARLEEARIGTIHSFCAELLRQRPVEAKIPPGFEEMDENQAPALYSRAFNSWIQTTLQAMPEGIRRALNRVGASAFDNESPLDQIRRAGWTLIEWRDFGCGWRREDFDPPADIERILPEIHELAKMTATCNVAGHPVRKHLQCVVDFVARIQRSEEVRRRDYDELEALLVQLARNLRRYSLKGSKKFSPSYSRDEILAAQDRLQSNLDQFVQHSEADLAASLQEDLQGLIEQYEVLKAQSGKLDFGDLLIRSRNLLRENHDVRRFMQEQFTHIFVDEFQDTDPVQAEILVLLSADDSNETDWRAIRPKPGKLFLVGDPKQSIYRFRRADIIMYQDLTRLLQDKGIAIEYLSRSFRSVRPIQEAVNAAFAPEMTGNTVTGQPAYVPLEEVVPTTDQPSVVVLPAPYPYGARQISKKSIDECLPSTVAAYVDWLIRESGWKVRAAGTEELVPIASEHIAILFRRFVSWGDDITRGYVHALEARGIPHLLWGARSFHQREEIETVRAALNAIEWPDDELSLYATLRGGLFALSDNLLLRYKDRVGSLHPFHAIPEDLEADFLPVAATLRVLGEFHRHRNRRPIVETVNSLLEAPRCHASFALRPSGNQVLANVFRICDLARTYEQGDGYSFRGFVELLNSRAEREDSGEAPVLEEGTEGVRIMTVHSAKGLEFPVVILADMTANIASRTPDKHVDADLRLCAVRLLGCAPWDLIDHEQEEHERDIAEGIRIAYVAATRARDLLVVAGVGDGPQEGWLGPLNKAIYPQKANFRASTVATACPPFGNASVLLRQADYDGSPEFSVRPGLHSPENGSHKVVWWDPALLNLHVDASFGLRQEEILVDDNGGHASEGQDLYDKWKFGRNQSIDVGRVPTTTILLATDDVEPPVGYSARVEVVTVPRSGGRPQGRRFGTLVHLIMKDIDLRAAVPAIERLAHAHARLLNATDKEIASATQTVTAALQHPLLVRAQQASSAYRELPISTKDPAGNLIEGVIDLAFVEETQWTVIDFKTDSEDMRQAESYRWQVGWYVYSVEKTVGGIPRGVVLHL